MMTTTFVYMKGDLLKELNRACVLVWGLCACTHVWSVWSVWSACVHLYVCVSVRVCVYLYVLVGGVKVSNL